MNKLLHWLAHKLGLNYGQVVSKRDSDGYLWMGFQCNTCGVITGKHRTVDIYCPVCGYHCVGKGGHGCIHKQDMI